MPVPTDVPEISGTLLRHRFRRFVPVLIGGCGSARISERMFEGLIGNTNAKRRLERMFEVGRLPNALLFTGPEGVGKRSFALGVTRLAICAAGGCGKCPACERAGRFTIPPDDEKNKDDYKRVFFSEHLDVGMVVPYKRNILVDAIRDLEREAHFRPYEAETRVFIIDNAEKMNDQAANALLKTLEEPPATSHIILVTSQPDRLLPTIRSRTQAVRFGPVAANEVEEYLAGERGFSNDDARLAAIASKGSIGSAVSLDLAAFRQQRSAMLGVLRDAAVARDLAALLSAGEAMNEAKNKENFEPSLDILETLARDVMVLAAGGSGMIANSDITAELGEIAEAAGARRAAEWITAIEETRTALNVNLNKKIAADSLFVRFAGA